MSALVRLELRRKKSGKARRRDGEDRGFITYSASIKKAKCIESIAQTLIMLNEFDTDSGGMMKRAGCRIYVGPL